jgi:prepilin-type N-terminal cleavage/methylation domain-containing protein
MHKRGFTLIELLTVIAIIGLLATIIIVSLSGAKGKSRDARRQADLKSIQLALSLYYTDNGVYPVNIYGTGASAPTSGLAPTYLPVVPIDPNAPSGTTCANSSGTYCYKYAPYSPGDGTTACTAAGCPTAVSCTNSQSVYPVTYHLGAALENPSDAIQDVDADTGSTYLYTGYKKCSGFLVPFQGNATNCSGSSGASPDACYDQAP